MLTFHPHARLEYWFFKVNAGSIALLVDWIVHRDIDELILRVSIHSSGKHEVLFEKLGSAREQITLTAKHTAGRIGEIGWDLTINDYQKWIAPDLFPAQLLRMTDLTITSAPLATFTGWISYGAEHVKLDQASGLVSQYWGRQLTPEWWWVSANQFQQKDIAVECLVTRSGLWGIPVEIPFAYLYLRQSSRERLLLAPPASHHVAGTRNNFEIKFSPLRGVPITLRAKGSNYNDLGERITNTLIGDLEIYEGETLVAQALGTAGLERREPSTS